jgi:hypothetical protein
MMILCNAANTLRVLAYTSTTDNKYDFYLYDGANNPTQHAHADIALGGRGSFICRYAPDGLFMMVNGTANEGAIANSAVNAMSLSKIIIGGTVLAMYEGPLFVCPSKLTDAETVLLDAGIIAGWGGLELYSFFNDRGYRNTLILPLKNDSVGSLVV